MLEFQLNSLPTLATDRLTLRKLGKDDAFELFALRSDERVNQFLDRERASSVEDARKFIDKIEKGYQSNETLYWAITLKDDFKLIGTITLWNISKEESKAELGYELLPDFQGKGFMQEAISKVIEFGFSDMNLETIEAFTHAGNEKSLKLLEKNNFARDFVQEEKMKSSDQLGNMVIYSLTRTGMNL